MSRPKKNTTLRQFLFQDFDSDGVKNVDDPYPYDKSRSRWPDGGTTASVYSSKLLAEKILKKSKRKGSVVKASLNYCPRTPLSNKKYV